MKYQHLLYLIAILLGLNLIINILMLTTNNDLSKEVDSVKDDISNLNQNLNALNKQKAEKNELDFLHSHINNATQALNEQIEANLRTMTQKTQSSINPDDLLSIQLRLTNLETMMAKMKQNAMQMQANDVKNTTPSAASDRLIPSSSAELIHNASKDNNTP